jgi:flagellar hook-associated protein 3 FlgL
VEKEVYRLLDKFGLAHDQYNKVYADVSARSEFLVANGASLKDQGISLNEQIVDIENVDPAIQQFMYDYSCYNAALKVGTQILSQSLIDYMS